MTAPGSAETANIDAARGFFTSLHAHLHDDLTARVSTARATLAGRRIDAATLATLDRIRTQISGMAATCAIGVEHLDAYHGNLEQAVNSTPEAADTDFYRPDTGATAAAAGPGTDVPTAELAEPSERDLLARGAHIAVSTVPRRQRDRAREWDAGRVDAQERTAAYEYADAVLADRAQIAAGPGAERMTTMRDHGILRCPAWCPQSDDEHEHEAHIGPPRTFTTEDSDTITVRPRVSWWDGVEPAVELTVTPAEDGDGALVLTGADLARLQQLSTDVLADAEQQYDHPDRATGKPAYPGAVSEHAGAEHAVDDPAAAAAALDLQSRAGGYYLNEDSAGGDESSGPYLDWSSRAEDGTRQLEVGDGVDAITLDLCPADLQQLRDDLGRLVGAATDGAEDPGQLQLDGEDDGAYIDWSITRDGVRQVEFGDSVDAVQLELTDAQLREWHARLESQAQLDGQDEL
ncbi:hypothetical protein [Paractinoplanes atraurantiacus]|uniref:Uncharacterized protein n=1 Tax=Paractinoplanes atraurantiacus TaxID=1036182 RepID=A0A285KJY7_9ACTN|nr:hypothetical protein [Actinoplanes atraurantiacus]SNY72915.1 hypothetical protein SAMN05421748_14456 [Actinoplanes atraurantiacus]